MSSYMIEKFKAKDGSDSLKINGYYIHSKYNTKREAEQFVESIEKEATIYFFWGYGEGHYVRELRKAVPNAKIIVIEPYLVEISNKITGIDILLSSNIDEIERFINIKLEFGYVPVFLITPNYEKIDIELFKAFEKVFSRQIELNKISENTVLRYALDWQKNYFENLTNVVKDYSIENLFNKFSCPAVVISGGPSLIKQIEVLKKYKDKLLLICAGSTINSLLKYGIEPDLVISVDGGEPNYNHFKDIYLKKTNLCYSLYSHSKIRDSFLNSGYYFIPKIQDSVKNHFYSLFNEQVTEIEGGSSVAVFALFIATYLTNGPVTLIGQDLAYTNNQTHAIGNINNEKIDLENNIEIDIKSEKGYYGDSVKTNLAFISMRDSFVSASEVLNNREIFNSTEGGIYIEGYAHLTFIDFCEKFANVNVEKSILAKNNPNKREIDVLVNMKNELKLYSELNKVLLDLIQIIKVEKSKGIIREKNEKKITKLEDKMKTLITRLGIENILEPCVYYIYQKFNLDSKDPDEKFKLFMERSEHLYKEIKLNVEECQSVLRNVLRSRV